MTKKGFMKNRIAILVLSIVAVASLLCIIVSAAATGTHTPVTGVTVGVSGATDNSMSNGAVTVTAKGSSGLFGLGASAKTATITITNSSDSTAEISFDWKATSVNALVIDGTTYTSTSGSFKKTMKAGASITITITTAKNGTTNKLEMSNFDVVEAQASSKVTFEYNEALGTVTVGGTAVSNGAEVDIPASGASVVAQKSGSTFLGWVNANGEIISTAESTTLVAMADMTVKAVFADSTTPWFGVGSDAEKSVSTGLFGWGTLSYYTVGTSYLFDDLNDAAAKAASDANAKCVVLMNSGKLSAGTYTIPAGVTLLIPFDAANSLYTTAALSTARSSGSRDDGTFKDLYVIPSAYRTLTLADGANLIINGAMSLSAKHTYAAGGQDAGSSPSGPVSFVQMQGNSNITVNNGGALYAYGFITGSGSVTVNSGATVYELFQIMDFRGGTQSTDMDNGVFPLSQYYVQNIEVPMTIHYGATEYAYTTIYMSSADFGSAVNFIASKDAMFKLTSGYVVKKYNGSTDRLEIEINGNIEISSVDIKVSTSSINSKDYELPINGNISVTVKSGASITIGQDLAFLPGTEMIVEAGANCTLSSNNNLYIYDSAQWGSFCGASNKVVIPVKYAPGRTATRSTELKNQKDAALWINGVADFSAGYVYTTAGGANIYSTGVGIVNLKPGTQTITHQLVQGKGYTNIPITPAKLKNGDGNYFEYAKGNTFVYKNNVWQCKDHLSVPTEGKAPTCTEAGLSEGSECSACTQILVAQTTVPATGHASVTDAAVDATCTTAGKTEGSHCSVCSEVLKAQEVVSALNHKWVWGTTWTSVEDEGQKRICTCDRCKNTITVLLAYRMNSYIWLNATVSSSTGAPVCNEFELESGYLVQEVPSNHITDLVSVTFQIDAFGPTPALEIGFSAYKDIIYASSDKTTQTLLDKMILYGTAADVYFDPKEGKSVAQSTESGTTHSVVSPQKDSVYGEKVLNGTTISTIGATVYFDNALRLSVGYNLDLASGYTVSQLGVLVKQQEDWVLGEVLYADPDDSKISAYLAPVDKAEGWVTFDLLASQYESPFAIRTYAVITDGENQYVVYGGQYIYGLEAYITAKYGKSGNQAFDDLLYYTWQFAEAAYAKYPTTGGLE